MMRIKWILACCLLIISLVMSGCYKSQDIINIDNRKNIQFIAKMRSGDYWNTVKAGADAAAQEFNVNLNFIAPDNEKDINEQIKLLNRAVEDKADAIVLAPSDYDALAETVEKAYNNLIPTIIVDSEVKTNKIDSYIATNNIEAGREAGKKLVELTGKRARIAIMSFVRNAGSAIQREQGVLDELSKYPGIEIVDKEYCLSDDTLAVGLTRKIITENKQLDGIVALSSSASEGVAQALSELDLAGKVKLVAFDCDPEEIEYLDKGVIQATVVQNHFNIGYLGVKYAAMAARGEKVPQSVDTGFKVIDRNSMYLPENQKTIFPFIK